MIVEKIALFEQDEYSYPYAGGFVPFMTGYRHEGMEPRPALVIAPGGGYRVVSPREGEVVAKRFYDLGFQAFVVTYTVNPLMKAPLRMQPLKDLSRAVRLVRRRSEDLGVRRDQVAVCGFSAAGHLCASLCVHFEDVPDREEYSPYSNRPDAAILSYPVITSGPLTHQGSMDCLLGPEATDEEKAYFSLENHVNEKTPPCFIWQTDEDETVPVENSYLMAAALRRAGRPYALHIFTHGHHGISTADEEWARVRNLGAGDGSYTMAQFEALREAIGSGALPLPEEERQTALGMLDDHHWLCPEHPWSEVRLWPDMAAAWLRVILEGRE